MSGHHAMVVSSLVLCGCLAAPSGPEPLSDAERSAAREYATAAPLVLGALPLAHEGASDPLVRFAAFPNYTSHFVVMDGTEVRGVVVLFKRGTDGDALVAAATEEACGQSSRCRDAVERVEVTYSLTELRSIAGWVARSPLRFVSTQTLVLEEDGGYVARVRLLADESRLDFLRELLMEAGSPADAWEVALNRYMAAN